MSEEIIIQGAREHNLKNINVTLPKNKLVAPGERVSPWPGLGLTPFQKGIKNQEERKK